MAKKREKSDLELVIALCSSNWNLKNLFMFERKKEDSQIFVVRAKTTIKSYRKIKSPSKTIYIKPRNSSKSDLETSSNRLF